MDESQFSLHACVWKWGKMPISWHGHCVQLTLDWTIKLRVPLKYSGTKPEKCIHIIFHILSINIPTIYIYISHYIPNEWNTIIAIMVFIGNTHGTKPICPLLLYLSTSTLYRCRGDGRGQGGQATPPSLLQPNTVASLKRSWHFGREG